jgi:hypothetical protein
LDFQTGDGRALAHSFGCSLCAKAGAVPWGVTLPAMMSARRKQIRQRVLFHLFKFAIAADEVIRRAVVFEPRRGLIVAFMRFKLR